MNYEIIEEPYNGATFRVYRDAYGEEFAGKTQVHCDSRLCVLYNGCPSRGKTLRLTKVAGKNGNGGYMDYQIIPGCLGDAYELERSSVTGEL